MSMSDKEDCTYSFGPGTSNFRGVVHRNEFEPSTSKKHQSPKAGRRGRNPVTARSKRSNQLSSRSCTQLKGPLPPINRQSSIVSSSSEASIDARRHCGRLNYSVFKPPCFEHAKTENKSRAYNNEKGDARHSDESETSTRNDGKISPPGDNSNRTVLSTCNFNLLYGKESPRDASFPNHAECEEVSDTSESEQPTVRGEKDYAQFPLEINPNFRSYWDLTGMYQTGDSCKNGPLQEASLELPESGAGKSDSDSLRNSEQLGSSARMRRREKTRDSFSTSFSQSAYTSSPYSPYAPSPNPISSTNSPRTPCYVDLESVSSKSNDDIAYGEQQGQEPQDFKQNEKIEEKRTDDIDEVLKSYRSVNSERYKVKHRFSRDAFEEEDLSPLLHGKAESTDKFVVAADIHPENTDRSLKSNPVLSVRSNLVRKKSPTHGTAKRGARRKSPCSQYPSSPNKIETLSMCSDVNRPTVHSNLNESINVTERADIQPSCVRRSLVKMGVQSLQSLPMVHRNLNANIKVTEGADIQTSCVRRSLVKMGVQSLQYSSKHVKTIGSKLIESEDPQEELTSTQSARVAPEHSPRLSVKKPEVLSAKFTPYWPEGRTQLSSSSVFKGNSPSSLCRKRKSPSPTNYKDNRATYSDLHSPRRIKVPNFPKSLDNSPKQPCPLTSRSLQIQKLKPSISPPLPRKLKTQSVTKRQRTLSPFDFRLKLPPSPSPPPPSPSPDTLEKSYDYGSDSNWVRMEPYPGCVQYCPVEKQQSHRIEFKESNPKHSELSPFESSDSSKKSKLKSNSNRKSRLQDKKDEISVKPSIMTTEIAVEPCIVATMTQKERNSEIFQQKKYNMKSSPGSLPAWSGGTSGRRNQQALKSTRLMNRQEDYKLANAWFESEISGLELDRHDDSNRRVQTPESPISVVKAVVDATPAEEDPPATSQVSNDSIDNISLETVPENDGLCTRLGNLCRSLGSRWFAECNS